MEGCPKPSSSVLKNNIFHCGQGCLKPSSIFQSRIFHCGHGPVLSSFRGPFKLLKPFGGSWRLLGASWAFLALLVYNGGARKTIHWMVRPSWPGALWRGGPSSSPEPGPFQALDPEIQGLVSRKVLLVRPLTLKALDPEGPWPSDPWPGAPKTLVWGRSWWSRILGEGGGPWPGGPGGPWSGGCWLGRFWRGWPWSLARKPKSQN